MASTTNKTSNTGKTEVGKPGTSLPKGSQSAGALTELIRRENMQLEQIVEQMDRDYQVNLAYRVLSANASQADISFNVEAEGRDEATLQRLESLSERIAELWEKTHKSMMPCIKYGRVAYEKIWDYDEKQNLAFIRKLEELPFRQTKMLINKKDEPDPGSFKGIELRAKGEEVIFYQAKAWWLAFEPTALEPHGKSMYAGAPYWTWRDRKEARDMRSKYIRRFALGGAVITGPDRVIDEETGEPIDAQQAAADAYGALQGGGVYFRPNDRVPSGEPGEGEFMWEIEPQGITQQSDSPITSSIDALDSEQLVAFGIPPKTVIEGDSVGSFALVTQQMLILFSVVEDILDEQIGSFQQYVINKQVERNVKVEKDERLIVATYERLTNRPDDLSVQLVTQWMQTPQLSPFVLSGAVDVAAVMETVGIPLSEGAEAKIAKMIEVQREAAKAAGTPGEVPGNTPESGANPQTPPANGSQNGTNRLTQMAHANGNGNGDGPPLIPFPKRMG